MIQNALNWGFFLQFREVAVIETQRLKLVVFSLIFSCGVIYLKVITMTIFPSLEQCSSLFPNAQKGSLEVDLYTMYWIIHGHSWNSFSQEGRSPLPLKADKRSKKGDFLGGKHILLRYLDMFVSLWTYY